MYVKTYIQGVDHSVYQHVGQWIVSRKLSEELGNSIHADDEDIWFVLFDKNDVPIGFSLVHQFKYQPTAHIRFFFVIEEKRETKARNFLLNFLLKYLKSQKLQKVYVLERRDEFWIKHKFIEVPSNRRSSFVKFEKKL